MTTSFGPPRKCAIFNPASELWWKKAKEVMKHEAQASSIPALKTNDGVWVLNAQARRTCSLTRLRESASSHGQVRMSTQSVIDARISKDPLFSRQRSNVGTLSRTSVRKAPLVPHCTRSQKMRGAAGQTATDPVVTFA